jgi:hypothetical protein
VEMHILASLMFVGVNLRGYMTKIPKG